jgi:predicted DNA-binding transcriptional regulator YafY
MGQIVLMLTSNSTTTAHQMAKELGLTVEELYKLFIAALTDLRVTLRPEFFDSDFASSLPKRLRELVGWDDADVIRFTKGENGSIYLSPVFPPKKSS